MDQVVVIKLTTDSKSTASGAGFNPRHHPDAIHSYLAAGFSGREEDFDSHLRPHRRACGGENECAVQRNISRETASGMRPFVFPVEYHWQMQRVPCRGPALVTKHRECRTGHRASSLWPAELLNKLPNV